MQTTRSVRPFEVVSEYAPSGDQPQAIAELAARINAGETDVVLLGATGTGKSATTAWLIEQHMLVHRIIDGSLGQRAHRRLRECEWYDDLILLGECDRAGRVAGAQASELDEAIDYLREISDCYG